MELSRSGKNPLTVLYLKELIRSKNPSVVFLMETKQNCHRNKVLRKQCGFHKGLTVDPIGNAGGLSIWWKSNVDIVFLEMTKNWIDAMVNMPSESFYGRCTWLYGTPYNNEKTEFWEEMLRWERRDSEPWMVIGDFNEICWQHEKDGGSGWNTARRRFLIEFMQTCNLVDLGFKGQGFTWERFCGDELIIRERLDRAIVNPEWLENWQNTCVIHCAMVGSDHCPILLDSNPICQIKKGRIFRFETRWLKEEECGNIVKRLWRPNDSSTHVNQWTQNLHRCKTELLKWNKVHFPNCKIRINEVVEELGLLQNASSSDVSIPKQRSLKAELDKLWRWEEQFWRQRSRINWLQSGDSNTKFFHLTTIQRRQRNRVLKIRSNSGDWLVDEHAIRNEFFDFFSNLFKTAGPRDWSSTLNNVDRIVTPEMNSLLLEPFNEDEIKTATQQLGADKAPGPDGFPGMFYNQFWDIVKPSIFGATCDFQRGWCQLEELNKTFIALIPKTPDP